MSDLRHSLTRCITALQNTGNTMRNMENEALVNRLAEVKAEKVAQTLTFLKTASRVITLLPTMAEMERK